MIEYEINKIFEKESDVLYGYADISYSSYFNKYKSALVFAVPYSKQLYIDTYKEKDFEQCKLGYH